MDRSSSPGALKKHGQTIMMNLRWCIVLCISGPYGRLLLFGIEKKKRKKNLNKKSFDYNYHSLILCFFFLLLTTSDQVRLPAEFKHITKRRKRN